MNVIKLVTASLIHIAIQPPLPGQTPAPSHRITIPTRDLSRRADLQVTVDREPSQYLGHPTTLLLEDDKTILCVYPKGHGRGAIIYKRSADGGKTWSERLPTPANWSTSLETPTLHRLVDRNGHKRIVMFSGLYPIRSAVSEDDGLSWSELKPIGEFGGIVAMGDVIRTRDKSYLAFFHDDGRYFSARGRDNRVFTLFSTRSIDAGLTWARPKAIFTAGDIHLCEPGVVRSPDGRELAMLLRENTRTRNSYIMFSRDEGKTWTTPSELPAALTGDRHVARYLRDGRLFVTFRDMAPESGTRGDWVAWVGRYSDLKNGGEGQFRLRLMQNLNRTDCGYAGCEVLHDGTVVTTSYGHWTEGEQPYIVCIRIHSAQLR